MHFLYYLDAYCLDGIKKAFQITNELVLVSTTVLECWYGVFGVLDRWKKWGFQKDVWRCAVYIL